MNETLREFVDSRGVTIRVDRAEGVIRGVKILGLHSHNGRTYLPETLARAVELYEGAKVNVNHAKTGPLAPRDYQDRIGVIRNVAVRDTEGPAAGLFADFHFNPKHQLAEQLTWDAEHAPENVGFSHNVLARTARRGDRVVVEAITKVQSVDLVADPATTRGLFEAAADRSDPTPELKLAEATVEDLRQHRGDLVESVLDEQAGELEKLREEIDRLRAAEALERKRRLMRRLLTESGLPDPEHCDDRVRPIVGQQFVDALLAAPDEQAMRELVAERTELVQSLGRRGPLPTGSDGRPVCRDQNQLDVAAVVDAESFVQSIT